MTQPAESSGPPKGSVSLDSLLPPTGAKKALEPVAPPPLAPTGPVIPGVTPLDGEDIKKAETLGDLRTLFPELQREGSETTLTVERIHPKIMNGQNVAGVIGKFSANCQGHDVLNEEGFRSVFGPGDYIVWVEGPSRKKVDPVTGRPVIIRKTNGEVKVKIAEVTMTQQHAPMFAPQPTVYDPASVERAKSEGRVLEVFANHAVRNFTNPQGSSDPAAAAMAAEAIRGNNELAQQTIAQQAQQLQALQTHIYQLQEKLSETGRVAPQDNELLKFMLSKGSGESDQLRLRYEDQIERMRQDYDNRLERQRNDYEARLRNDRDAFDKNEDRIRSEFDQKLERANTLAEDRFRQEREHHRLVQESKAKDYENSLAALTNDHAREVEVLRNEAQRNLSNQERVNAMLVQDKQAQIDRLNADIVRLNGELDRFRNKEQKPLHVQIQELRGINELLDSLAPQREEAPVKESTADKILGAIATPQGIQAMAPILAGLAQRAGVLPPGAAPGAPAAPQIPTGQPAPRQMGPAQQQRQGQRPRGARSPVSTPEMPFRDPNVPPPPSPPPPANVSPQSPAPQAAGPAPRRPQFKTEPPFTKEEFQKYLPMIEAAAFDAVKDRTDPVAFADLTLVALGSDTVSKLVSFADGENFSLLLDMVTKGERGWSAEPRIQWVRELWDALAAKLAAAPQAAAQAAPVESPPQP